MHNQHQKPHQDKVSEVMQYDYLYQQSMEKIEHMKKGIGTCLNGQAKKKTRRRKNQRYEIGRPEDHDASLLSLYAYILGMDYVLVEGNHTQIQCF